MVRMLIVVALLAGCGDSPTVERDAGTVDARDAGQLPDATPDTTAVAHPDATPDVTPDTLTTPDVLPVDTGPDAAACADPHAYCENSYTISRYSGEVSIIDGSCVIEHVACEVQPRLTCFTNSPTSSTLVSSAEACVAGGCERSTTTRPCPNGCDVPAGTDCSGGCPGVDCAP